MPEAKTDKSSPKAKKNPKKKYLKVFNGAGNFAIGC